MKGRAAKRHRTRAKVEKAKTYLRRIGFGEDEKNLAVRAKKFASSHWGCNCCLCKNPRKLNRGSKRDELTLREFHQPGEEE